MTSPPSTPSSDFTNRPSFSLLGFSDFTKHVQTPSQRHSPSSSSPCVSFLQRPSPQRETHYSLFQPPYALSRLHFIPCYLSLHGLFTHASALSTLIISKQHRQSRSHSSRSKPHFLHNNSPSHAHASCTLPDRFHDSSNSRVLFASISKRVSPTSRFRSFDTATHIVSYQPFISFIGASTIHHLISTLPRAAQHGGTLPIHFPNDRLQTTPQ